MTKREKSEWDEVAKHWVAHHFRQQNAESMLAWEFFIIWVCALRG